MKNQNKYFNITLALMATIGLGACSDNDFDGLLPDSPNPDSATLYIPLGLQMPSENSRGDVDGEFDYGNFQDVAFAPGDFHYAIFYDGVNPKPIEVSILEEADPINNNRPGDNYSLTIAKVLGKNADEAEEYFKNIRECIVILNTDIPYDYLLEAPKNELLDLRLTSPYISINGMKYFTMSNAVYSDGKNAVTEHKFQIDFKNQVFETQIEAMEAAREGNAAVVAHVERITAKFKIQFAVKEGLTDIIDIDNRIFAPKSNKLTVYTGTNTTTGTPQYENEKYRYQIRLTGWGINAREKESYLFKKIRPDGGYFYGWNDIGNFRSYWSEDPHYYATDYPIQYRKRVEDSRTYYAKAGANNILQNISYSGFEEEGNFVHNTVYVPENTYDFTSKNLLSNLGERTPLLAGSHLIVTAELLTDFDGKGYKTNDVYRDRNGVFYQNLRDMITDMVSRFNYTLNSHSMMKFTSYAWSLPGNVAGNPVLTAFSKGDFMLYHKGNPVTTAYIKGLDDETLKSFVSPAEVINGDGQVLLWSSDFSIRNSKGEVLRIVTAIETDKYGQEVPKYRSTPMTLDEVKSLIYEWVGAIDHFSNGKMYYAVPILFYDSDNNPDTTDNNIYGVVRNCTYNFVINSIGSYGTSVDDPTQPIVPDKISSRDKFFVGIELLDWHKITENVPGVIN